MFWRRKKIYCCNPECKIDSGVIKGGGMSYDGERREVYHGLLCANDAAVSRGDIQFNNLFLTRAQALELLEKGDLNQPR